MIKLAVDAVIPIGMGGMAGYVLIERRWPPLGWALPGGFVDDGETLREAVVREVEEETSLLVEVVRRIGIYDDPGRDPRGRVVSVAFHVRPVSGTPRAKDDARNIGVFKPADFPTLAFDHARILGDYFRAV